MFQSEEVRWFKKELSKPVIDWFHSKNYSFDKTSPRTDYYLPVQNNKGIGIKLREGSIEVKHLFELPAPGKLLPKAEGYFEKYIKWSFDSSDEDALSKAIIQENKYDWVAVKKTRIGFKLTEKAGNIEKIEIDEYPDSGCQVEYTKVEIKNETWYTFGLEWFGNKKLEIPGHLLHEILGSEQLFKDDSMGYADFILRNNPGKNY